MDGNLKQEEYVAMGGDIARKLLDNFSPEEQRRTLEVAHEVIKNSHKQAIENSEANLKDANSRLDEFLGKSIES